MKERKPIAKEKFAKLRRKAEAMLVGHEETEQAGKMVNLIHESEVAR